LGNFQGKAFWNLQPYMGIQINAHIKSVLHLSQTSAYGYFKPELFLLLSESQNTAMVTSFLLDHYFANQKAGFISAKNMAKVICMIRRIL
jgi:putative restriction endonuclease